MWDVDRDPETGTPRRNCCSSCTVVTDLRDRALLVLSALREPDSPANRCTAFSLINLAVSTLSFAVTAVCISPFAPARVVTSMFIIAICMGVVTSLAIMLVDVRSNLRLFHHLSLVTVGASGVVVSIVSGGRTAGTLFVMTAYLAAPLSYSMFKSGPISIAYLLLGLAGDIASELAIHSSQTGDEMLNSSERFALGMSITTSFTFTAVIIALFHSDRTYEDARASAFGMAVESADAAAKREKSANMEKTRFLSVMSHEIRTPLTGLLLHQDLLSQTRLSTYQKEHCYGMRRCADLVLALVSSVLDVAKIEAGTVRATCAPFRLRDTCELIVSSHAAACAAKGVEIVLVYPPSFSSHVVGDEAKIRQVLNNLVSNAVKFTPSGSVVLEVSAEVVDEQDPCLADPELAPLLDELAEATRGTSNTVRWHFEVRDTGIGIPRTELPRTFQEFSRLHHPGHAPIDGTGLGLFITKQLTRLHGGTVSVTSEVGKGSTFAVNALMGGRAFPSGNYLSTQAKRARGTPSDLAITGLLVLTGLRDTFRAVRHYTQVILPSAQAVHHCTSVRELEGKVATMSKVHRALLLVVDEATVGPVTQVPHLLSSLDRCRTYNLFLTDAPRSTDAAALGRKGWHAIVEKPLYLSRFVRTIQSLATRSAAGTTDKEARRGGGVRRVVSPKPLAPSTTTSTATLDWKTSSSTAVGADDDSDGPSLPSQSSSLEVSRRASSADRQWHPVVAPVPAAAGPLVCMSGPIPAVDRNEPHEGNGNGSGRSAAANHRPAFFESSPMRLSVDEAAPTILVMDPPYARSPGLQSVLDLVGGQVHQAKSTEHALTLWRQLHTTINVVAVNADEDLDVVVQFVRDLRHHETARRRPHVPIILVTSDRSVGTHSRLAALPVNDILQAPVSTKNMRAALAGVLPTPPSTVDAGVPSAVVMSTSPPKGQVKVVRRQKSSRRGGNAMLNNNSLRTTSSDGQPHGRKRANH